MSTHCALGIKHSDGKITGCYVHYDGSTMEPRIQDFINKKTTTGLFTLIAEAQARGGIRGFHTPADCFIHAGDWVEHKTDFLDDNEPYVIDETNFYDDHMGTFAWYLVDYESGTVERTDKW